MFLDGWYYFWSVLRRPHLFVLGFGVAMFALLLISSTLRCLAGLARDLVVSLWR